mgnify:CR=1 FL=1
MLLNLNLALLELFFPGTSIAKLLSSAASERTTVMGQAMAPPEKRDMLATGDAAKAAEKECGADAESQRGASHIFTL